MTATPSAPSIEIWFIALHASPALESRFAQTLSPDERQRAARFATPALRRRFTLARAVLRSLLARYLALTPAEIVFGYEPAGKPFVQNPGAQIQFNLSHADDLAAYAITRDCRVGIDIERLRPMPDLESIAQLFFTPEEHAALERLPPPARTAAFFRSWTRKEAYVKATGLGLSMPLQAIPPGSYEIRDLTQDEYIGAIAFDSPGQALNQHPPCRASQLE